MSILQGATEELVFRRLQVIVEITIKQGRPKGGKRELCISHRPSDVALPEVEPTVPAGRSCSSDFSRIAAALIRALDNKWGLGPWDS